ncbi:MAG: DUF2905 domain-containing protein [Phascolarctobacterium sp.]|nr:DUF2905 domain-containing protein [Phascolarctobacterium sp.]
MGKTLISIGAVMIVVGCVLHFGGKFLPLGRLPGDINITGEHGSFHFPIVTCILLSVIFSIISRLFR